MNRLAKAIALSSLSTVAGVAFILVLIIPNRREQRGERWLARGILGAARQRPEHGRHGLEVLFVYSCDELRLGQNHRTTPATKVLQEPQPLPARVASVTTLVVRLSAATQAPSAALVTPLQLQTCMSAGISSIVICAEVEEQR